MGIVDSLVAAAAADSKAAVAAVVVRFAYTAGTAVAVVVFAAAGKQLVHQGAYLAELAEPAAAGAAQCSPCMIEACAVATATVRRSLHPGPTSFALCRRR